MSDSEKKHILNLLDWLHTEVISSCGDGDAFWLSKHYTLYELYPIVVEYNSTLKWPWEVKLEPDCINWGEGQEGVIITNSKEFFDKWLPSWSQCTLIW